MYFTNPVDAVTREAEGQVLAELRAQQVQRKAEDLRQAIESYGDDTSDNGAVVSFSKQLDADGKAYVFAAVKAAGFWYITGRHGDQRFTWDALVQWLVFGVPATGWTRMVPFQDATTEPEPTTEPAPEPVSDEVVS